MLLAALPASLLSGDALRPLQTSNRARDDHADRVFVLGIPPYSNSMAENSKNVKTTTNTKLAITPSSFKLDHAIHSAEARATLRFRCQCHFDVRQRNELCRGRLVHSAGHALRNRPGNIRRSPDHSGHADAAVHWRHH